MNVSFSKMKKLKPVRITFPKIKPEKAVGEYKVSQAFNHIDKLYAEFDVVRQDDPKSYLAMLQINLQHTEKLLRQKRKAQLVTRKHLNQQWKELALKEKSFRENFQNFNLFVRENMEKRDRAQKKLLEDQTLLEQRQMDIGYCIQNYYEIQQAKRDMDLKIKEYHLYEEYLERVVEYSAEFTSVSDMINRYLSLINARTQLAQFQEDNLRALENARSDMMKLIEEKNFIIMGLNNQIASLQARYENANIKSLECERLVTHIKNNAVKQMNEIDEVKSSMWNVYVQMAESKKHPIKIKKEDIEEQMNYIKRTLTELAKINHILKKRAKVSKIPSKIKN